MRFEIHGTLEAASIDDAFYRLGEHFDALYLGEAQDTEPGRCAISISPEAVQATERAEAS